MTIFSFWILAGLYLDGWAHRHLHDLDTFFTPWHAVLYSGFFAAVGFLGFILLRSRSPGVPWRRKLPAGYRLSIIGVLVFFGGGIGDLIWHTVFGIEADLDALLSPTHLILAIGGVPIGAAPFRAAWQRSDGEAPHRLVDLLPMLFSLAFVWSVLTFFTQFAHSFVHPWAAGPAPQAAFFKQSLELAGILLQTGIMMGLVLLAVWRWVLPFGSLALIFTINALLMSLLEAHYAFVAVGLLAGFGGDLLVRGLKPSRIRPVRFRLFAALVPVLFYALYFLALGLSVGIWWSVHMWTGAIVLAGIAGWLLSYLILPHEPTHSPA